MAGPDSIQDGEPELRGVPAPWAGLRWQALTDRRNDTKSRVYSAQHQGRQVICKDGWAACRRPLVGFYRRWSLRNETRVLRALEGIAGVPRLLDAWDTGLVMERLPGRPLGTYAKGAVPDAVFDDLERILSQIHARRLAVADLHRSNVLVDGSRAGLVDFEAALDGQRWFRRPLHAYLVRVDRVAAARLRHRQRAFLGPQHERLLSSEPWPLRFWRRHKRRLRSVLPWASKVRAP